MYIGLDVGTSRCKSAVVDSSGRVLRAVSGPTPPGALIPARGAFDSLVGQLSQLVRDVCGGLTPAPRLSTVSAITPALVGFHYQSAPQILFTHLTPSGIHYPQGDTLESRLAFRRARTDDRIASAVHLLGPSPTFFLPLASAIAFVMGGQIILDPINAYELGFRSTAELSDFCRLDKTPHGVRSNGTSDWSVTSDTCASMVGAGLRYPSDGMIYYGTYHCAHELALPVIDCLRASSLPTIPYFCHVCLPQYGRFLERVLCALQDQNTPRESLNKS